MLHTPPTPTSDTHTTPHPLADRFPCRGHVHPHTRERTCTPHLTTTNTPPSNPVAISCGLYLSYPTGRCSVPHGLRSVPSSHPHSPPVHPATVIPRVLYWLVSLTGARLRTFFSRDVYPEHLRRHPGPGSRVINVIFMLIQRHKELKLYHGSDKVSPRDCYQV